MKTVVSIPDAIFADAEKMAGWLGISRSQLYAKALKAFLEAHHANDVTGRLDEVYATEESRLDPALAAMQAFSIRDEAW